MPKIEVLLRLIGTVMELIAGQQFVTLDEYDDFKTLLAMVDLVPDIALYEMTKLELLQELCRQFAEIDLSNYEEYSKVISGALTE